MEQMTLTEVVQDIHAMDEELWHYESRYGLRTRYFLELYEAGQLHDEDSLQTRDYSDWAACYEICLLYTSPSPRDRTRSRMPSSA